MVRTGNFTILILSFQLINLTRFRFYFILSVASRDAMTIKLTVSIDTLSFIDGR